MWSRFKSTFSNQIFWSAFIFSIGVIGIVTVIYCTVWGAALSDDSYYYISSARNLIAGKGFDLTPHFAPLLSLLLSAIGIFKIDPLISIRWVNAILFAVNIYLIARIIYTLTRSRAFSLIGAFFALISSTLIMIHSWAMSEALFTTLILFGLWVYGAGYAKSGWQIPLFTGIFFGLAAVTRYIGIAFLLTGGIYWLFEKGKVLRTRLRNAFVFSLSGIIPLFLWMIRNEILIGRPTNRVLAVHLIPESSWVTMLNTVLLWFIPGRFVHGKEILWLVGIVTLSVILVLYYLLRKHRGVTSLSTLNDQQKPIAFFTLGILAYLFILIISRSFFDERIPMDERLLSPILVLGLVLIVCLFAWQWHPSRWISISLIILLSLVITVTNLTRSIQMVQSYHEVGRGYASARDHISETYAYLRNRPSIPVYSNAFAAIYFWTGRVTNPIPSSSGIIAMKEDMKQTGAFLVIFDSIRVELYGTTREELIQGLVEQIRLSEATIYRSP